MKTERGGFRMLRHEQVMTPPHEDSYRVNAKLPDPTRCPDCGAVFVKGRWTWKKTPPDAPAHRCPACLRIHDNFPAGYLTIKGKFDEARRDAFLKLITAREAHAKAEHPLQRVMEIETMSDAILVTTTDGHLARGIAHALRDAFQGTLDLTYSHDENLVRAVWRPPR